MEEIEHKIKVVVEMLRNDIASEYQRYKSATEEKPINAFVSRNAALEKAKDLIQTEQINLNNLSMNGKRILMTGGFGFIGSNFINYCIDNYEDFRIANLDFRGVGSNTNNVKQHDNVQHYEIDIANDFVKGSSLEDMPEIDYVINFAAESHVDRSISTPSPFVRSNVLGTMQMLLLEASKKLGAKRFPQVSTDEVYGSVDSPAKENSPLIHRRYIQLLSVVLRCFVMHINKPLVWILLQHGVEIILVKSI